MRKSVQIPHMPQKIDYGIERQMQGRQYANQRQPDRAYEFGTYEEQQRHMGNIYGYNGKPPRDSARVISKSN